MTTRYLTAAQTAKLVRAALKADFPGATFSVRSSTYSMGASIHVHWTDGPTERAVAAVVGQFQGADFDGMQDLKTYRPESIREIDGTRQVVHVGADYVLCHREYSPAATLNAAMLFEARFGVAYDPNRDYAEHGNGAYSTYGQQLLWREFLAPVDLRAAG